MIIDVKSIVLNKKEELIKRVDKLKSKNIVPKLAVILASDDKASRIYVANKKKLCNDIGIDEVEYIFDKDVTEEKILETIDKLNNDSSINGILVQLPLYNHIDKDKVLVKINPKKDVDGLHPVNLGNLVCGKEGIVSCTPKGIQTILDSLNVEYEGKNAVIIGRSILVGKPMSLLLLNKGCTTTICHSKTEDLKKYTKKADILVVAVGKPNLITKDMVKKDAVVIDVGINRIDKKIVGDCDTINVSKKCNITPVPSGVGLTTVLSLMDNVIYVCENN